MKKIIIILTSALALIIISAIIFIKIFTNKPLPDYNQNVNLKNLENEVTVYRDNYAVPHIIAKNEQDLYRTAGYITAQDRLWQIDLIRRATQGTLSEIFGKDFFQIDLLLRALQINQKSEEIYKKLPKEQKIITDAYADGINQYIEQNYKKLPIEFKILGYKPKKWLPQNSLNIIGYMAWSLVSAWNNEIPLYKIQQKVDSALFKHFIPNFNKSMPIYYAEKIKNPKISEPIQIMNAKLLKLGIIPFMASNNWAVNNTKSESGKPILCNDMHLDFGIPGIWYQLHLIIENKMNVTGLSIPGAPGIIAGHNENIAWGLTNVMLDGTDFFIETLNNDSSKYLIDGNWKNLRIENEKIITKEGDTLTGKIKYTHRGPIISKFKNLNKAISMLWVGYQKSAEISGIYKINRAKNWTEFRNALKEFGAISQNFLYADINGNIGMQLAGYIPKRKTPGYNVFPGDTSLYDWTGYIPFDSLPYQYNPKCGYLASANNKTSNNIEYYITQYYFPDFRYRRIINMLEQKNKISTKDMIKIQADQKSAFVDDILKDIIFQIAKLNLKNEKYEKILEILTKWDGNMNPDKIAPLFFEQFNMVFARKTIEDEISPEIYKQFSKSKVLMNNLLLTLYKDKENILFDNITTKNKIENINDITKIAYQETINILTQKLGNKIENWKYGKIHTITLKHPLSKVKILNLFLKLNRGPFSVGGSNHTVSPFTYSLSEENYNVTAGASHRHIFTLNNWDSSLTIIPTGQSGNQASKFYCDQTEKYLENKYHKDIFSINAVKNNAKFVMKLKPEIN